MALAKEFGFEDYASPAGGCCFLTDEAYSRKLVDMWEARGDREYEMDDIMLLKVGRHLRPRPNFKMIISREEGENKFMEGYRKQYIHMRASSHPGPLVLIDGSDISDEDLELAARITARYGKGRAAEHVDIVIKKPDESEYTLTIEPMPPGDVLEEWHR